MKTRRTPSIVGRKHVVACGFLLLCLAIWLGYVFYATAIQRHREAEMLAKATWISVAIRTYYDANKMIPPRVFRNQDPRVRTGVPLYSWRPMVSEFMMLSGSYGWMDRSMEWNSPENADALAYSVINPWQLNEKPEPGVEAQTNFFAVIHPRAFLNDGEKVFRYEDVSDGLDSTLVCIGLKNKHEPWLKPVDVTVEEAIALIAQLPDDDLLPLVFADGRASLAPPREITLQRLVAMTTIDGGEDISDWLKSLKWSD